MPTKRKNPAAVSLGRLSARKLSAAERSERGRRAIQARWHGKPKPKRWYVLFALDDLNHPTIIDSDTDKLALRQRARSQPPGRAALIDYLEYDPTHFTLERKYEPNTTAQVKALSTLMEIQWGEK